MVAATIVRSYAIFEFFENLPGAPVNCYIQFFSKADVFERLNFPVLVIHPQGHPNISQLYRITIHPIFKISQNFVLPLTLTKCFFCF